MLVSRGAKRAHLRTHVRGREKDVLSARSRIAWRVASTELMPSSPSLIEGLMSLIASAEENCQNNPAGTEIFEMGTREDSQNKEEDVLSKVLITSKSPSKKSLSTPSRTLRKVSSACPLGRAAKTSYEAEGDRLS